MSTKHSPNNIDDDTQISENKLPPADSNEDNDDSTRLTSKAIKTNPPITDSSFQPENTDQNTTQFQNTRPLSGTGALLKERFDLLEVIGAGGMGTVYKSLDRRDLEAGSSSFIAVKVINDEYKNNTDLLKALHSEARKTQSLAHPNIVTVYDFDRDNDTVFITMEFIDGVPLNKIIKANPQGLPSPDALKIVNEMAQALIYAHSKSIIHLDFKPGNVLVDQNNQVKIFDFGIARVANIIQARGFDASVLGGLTPSYASLEMFNNVAPDPRDDLYALACITYELLTGQHPFQRKGADIAKQQNLKPKKIKQLNKKQWTTLKNALAFDREDRIKDVNTFLTGMLETKSSSKLLITSLSIVSLAAIVFFLNKEQANLTQFFDHPLPPVPVTENKPVIETPSPDQQTTQNRSAVTEDVKTATVEDANILAADNIKIWTEKDSYSIGDKLQINFTVSNPMFIKIISVNSEGKSGTLYPNPYQPTSFCQPGTTYQIPPQGASFSLDVGEPKGLDKIYIFGSEQDIPDSVVNYEKDGIIVDEKLKQTLIQKSISYFIK